MNAEFADAELVGTFEPGSPEWHAARANGLGGSEIAAVMNLSPFESHYGLWHRKAGLIGPTPQSNIMKWGRRFEDDVIEELEERHPEWLIAPVGTYRSLERPWQIANPDRVAFDRAGRRRGIEAKIAYDDDHDKWGDEFTDEIPVYYRTQVMHYMDVTGLREFTVATLFMSGLRVREYAVRYDPVDAELIRVAGEAFMLSLKTGAVPDLDSHSATYQAVKELAAGVVDEAVEISPSLAEMYDSARARMKAAEADKREATSRILAAIGNRRYAECGTERVAIRTVRADGRTHSLQPVKG